MGNICCGGYEEEYKHGAWQGGHDDDDDEVSFANHIAMKDLSYPSHTIASTVYHIMNMIRLYSYHILFTSSDDIL